MEIVSVLSLRFHSGRSKQNGYKFPLNLNDRKRYLVGMQLLQPLADAGLRTYLVGPSALHMYFKRSSGRGRNSEIQGGLSERTPPVLWVETEASLVDLSRLFDGLSFPGAVFFDAALHTGQSLVLFRCIEPGHRPDQVSLQGAFRFEICRGVFQDPFGAYPYMGGPHIHLHSDSAVPYPFAGITVIEMALLMAHFGYTLPQAAYPSTGSAGAVVGREGPLSPIEQRFLLSGVLTGPYSAAALQFLMDSGFIPLYWPLLADMDAVAHSKEHHPEGNVWKHSLETFAHRKVFELELGLALLLHDCGKPYAQSQGGNRFDQHAQIGSKKTRRFLEELHYSQRVIQAVEYLVKNHMLPAAIPSLPTFRTEEVMASPLFPELLELYRCDVSSTFRGPDGYYRACQTYRTYLKHSRNPFRSSDGKKRLRLLVE